jgi:hypothetical protein
MTVAWVITQEGPRHSTEVIGILSCRKSAKDIKAYLEWFYALLHCSPRTHFDFARYKNPEVPCEAKYGTTNTGAPVDSLVRCGHNPYLVARRAKNVVIDVSENASVLKWTNPDRVIEQPPGSIAEKIPGAICEAPIHLPLRILQSDISEEDTALKVGVKDTEALTIGGEPFDLEQSLEQLVLDSIKLRQEEMMEGPPPCSEPKSTV